MSTFWDDLNADLRDSAYLEIHIADIIARHIPNRLGANVICACHLREHMARWKGPDAVESWAHHVAEMIRDN